MCGIDTKIAQHEQTIILCMPSLFFYISCFRFTFCNSLHKCCIIDVTDTINALVVQQEEQPVSKKIWNFY